MFIIDKEVLNKGLIIFRRGDVQHREFYCRVRVQHERRYKTVALKTEDKATARELAQDAQADIRFRVKHDVATFNRSFQEVAKNIWRLWSVASISVKCPFTASKTSKAGFMAC